MAGFLLTLHWIVGLISSGGCDTRGNVRLLHSRRLYAWQRRNSESERQSHYAHWLLTDGTRAKEIRLFDLGDRFRTLASRPTA